MAMQLIVFANRSEKKALIIQSTLCRWLNNYLLVPIRRSVSHFNLATMLTIFFLVAFSLNGNSQSESVYVPGLKGSISFQDEILGEIGFAFYKMYSDSWWINKAWGPSIAVEYNFRFNSDEFIWAPKVGYEYFFYYTLIQTGVHLTDYIQKGKHYLRLSPEIGISFLVVFNISYAYQLNVSGEELVHLSPSKISLKVNLFGLFNRKHISFNNKKFKNRMR